MVVGVVVVSGCRWFLIFVVKEMSLEWFSGK